MTDKERLPFPCATCSLLEARNAAFDMGDWSGGGVCNGCTKQADWFQDCRDKGIPGFEIGFALREGDRLVAISEEEGLRLMKERENQSNG